MGIVVGIDIGGSTTKIAAFRGEDMLVPVQISADNPVASLYGADFYFKKRFFPPKND